jgi:hypothetical protein
MHHLLAGAGRAASRGEPGRKLSAPLEVPRVYNAAQLRTCLFKLRRCNMCGFMRSLLHIKRAGCKTGGREGGRPLAGLSLRAAAGLSAGRPPF